MATSNVQVNEGQVSFKRMQGHKHDGITSSLIDTSQYSMFDFAATENSTDRAAKQSNNKKMLKTFIVSTIEERVLNPQGIRLQANAITAREITAGTITANELSANIVLVNNVIRSTNYVSNSTTKTGWLISSNGNAEFNDVTIRGNLISGEGFYAAANTKIFASSNGYFSLGNNFAWNGNSLTINGNITLSNTNVGTFDNGDSLTAGNIGGIAIGASSIRSLDYDANPTTAGFLINSDGTATFNEVTVRGTINANGGVFAGFLAAGNTQVGTNINGAAGYGGIRIGNRGWENAWVERNDGSIYFNAQNLSGSNRIYMDNTDALISFGNGAFSVSNTGALTATSGSIGGSVTIGGTAASTVTSGAASGASAVQPAGVNGNVTSISGGVITTGTINLNNVNVRTGTSGARINIDSSGLYAYNAAGTQTVKIGSDGSASFTGSVTGSSISGSTLSTSDGSDGILITSDGYIRGTGGSGVRIQNSDGSAGATQLFKNDIFTLTSYASLFSASGFQADGNGIRMTTTGQRPATLSRNYVAGADFIQLMSTTDSDPGAANNAPHEVGRASFATANTVIWSTSSDGRLKENVLAINNAIDTIKQLEPVTFNFINDEEHPVTGFIAQDVYKVLPSVVSIGGDDPRVRPWALDYSGFTPMLTAGLKEAITKIEELEARIQTLEGV